MGDLNCRHTQFGDHISNPEGIRLTDILLDLPIIRITNTDYTFLNANGTSIVDHIIVPGSVMHRFDDRCHIGDTITSDHLPILVNSDIMSPQIPPPPRQIRDYRRANWPQNFITSNIPELGELNTNESIDQSARQWEDATSKLDYRDGAKFWNKFKVLTKQKLSQPSHLLIDNQIISTPELKAEAFKNSLHENFQTPDNPNFDRLFKLETEFAVRNTLMHQTPNHVPIMDPITDRETESYCQIGKNNSPGPDNINDGNLAANWRRFSQKFNLYMDATDLEDKPEKKRLATFLSLLGDDGLELFNTFTFNVEGDDKKLQPVFDKFEEYCSHKSNGQHFDSFVTELKKAVKMTEYKDQDDMVRDRIVIGIKDKQTQESLLRESKLTLQKAITTCRLSESSKIQAKAFTAESTVDAVRSNRGTSQKVCSYCGFKHRGRKCPAYGKTCARCQGRNHFAGVCSKSTNGLEKRESVSRKRVHEVKNQHSGSESDDSELFINCVKTVGLLKSGSSQNVWKQKVQVKNCIVEFKLDTGAEVNVLPLEYIQNLEGAVPHVQPVRRVPHALHKKLKDKLKQLENECIVRKVEKPTEWLNPLVIVEKKNKDLRLCLDPKYLNKAIKREYFLIPTADEIAAKLCNKEYFSVLDMKDGYFQIKLDDQSADYCANEAEHDQNLRLVLERALKHNLRFNKEKIQFKLSSVKFLGQIYSKQGVELNQVYVKPILEMPTPDNKSDLMRLLGMAKFLGKFVPNMSKVTAPLRELTKLDVPWHWTASPVLTFFDPSKEIEIETDASKDGLGACLLQGGHPVAFASRSLSTTEQKYAQIEKEMLGIVFVLKKFHYFVYGHNVLVSCDHKPLESIVRKDICALSPRLQRMRLRLLHYDLNVVYKPGKYLYIADTLSRAFLQEGGLKSDAEFQFAFHAVVNNVAMSDTRKSEFRIETQKDEQLQTVINLCIQGWPEHKRDVPQIVNNFFKLRDNLCVCDNLLFYGNKIVDPKSLRSEMLRLVHEGHIGIEKSKARARQIFYWPGMSSDIETSCLYM
ncbi:uncharacterized protein [Diabrotica undecimpunctata]|uniref:uncharacterized protein n=1 Tax=Diabrotica undecimpunctata TaxID=50387 RepID=UPI003B6346F2